MSKLYLVGTPIGNLGDISPRALKALNDADFIAAEDTRVTLKLLNHFEIKKPLISYHEHNRLTRGEEIVARILAGESCAAVTDAGMPCISDPGEDLVRICAENGVEIVAVPGPSAFVTALAMSGLSTSRFCFEGFLSVNKKSRREHLAEIKDEPRTMIFYEAPHKLLPTLKDMLAALGDRQIALAREMTKLHEEVLRTTLSQVVTHYEANPPRGEFVLVIEGAHAVEPEKILLEDAVEIAWELVQEGMQVSHAAREVAKKTGHPKSGLYRALLEKSKRQG